MIKLQEDVSLVGYTLVIPSVAVGNVGQLCVDLIVSSLNLRRVGRVFDSAFIPLTGADPYGAGDDVCTALDIYASEQHQLVILQIRTPLVKRPDNFFRELLNFVADKQIAKVIILTSSFGHEKRDEQMRTAPFRYLATENVLKQCGKQFEDLSWIALEPKQVDDFSGQTILQIHGGGFAKTLFELFQKNDVFCVILLKFCSEGDNIPDAIELINYFNKWLKVIPVDNKNACVLRFPPSWKFLFGNLPPREIY